MNIRRGQGLHRLWAAFLCMVLCICLLPTSAFAATLGESGEATDTGAHGKLLIVADSSDGPVDGFAVIVKSADGAYTKTFTFEDTGWFEIEGLPTGDYTVSAVSNDASRGYIMPDVGEAQITAGKTERVHFYYARYKVTDVPEKIPQTGDGGPLVWSILFALSLLGCGVGVVLCRMKGKARKALPIAVLLVSAALCVGSTFMLTRDAGQAAEGADAYAQAASLAAEQTPAPGPTGDDAVDPPAGEEAAPDPTGAAEAVTVVQARPVPDLPLPTVNFTALREQGPEVAAWLTLPDTAIDYPVAQGQDNEYYLTHLYDGTENKAGCLFLDYGNATDFSDRNTVIYGHNMRDGSMFAALLQYAGQDYYNAHPNMLLVTPEGGFLVELFTAFEASPDEAGGAASPWAMGWAGEQDYAAWLADMRGRSLFESGVSVSPGDRVLTLSTCTGSGSSRFVVMGRLIPAV